MQQAERLHAGHGEVHATFKDEAGSNLKADRVHEAHRMMYVSEPLLSLCPIDIDIGDSVHKDSFPRNLYLLAPSHPT